MELSHLSIIPIGTIKTHPLCLVNLVLHDLASLGHLKLYRREWFAISDGVEKGQFFDTGKRVWIFLNIEASWCFAALETAAKSEVKETKPEKQVVNKGDMMKQPACAWWSLQKVDPVPEPTKCLFIHRANTKILLPLLPNKQTKK